MPQKRLTPHEQFSRECRSLLDRWTNESDMDCLVMADIAQTVICDWLDEPVVGFDPDPGLLGDGDGENQT